MAKHDRAIVLNSYLYSMLKFIVRLLLNAIAILVVAKLVSGIAVAGYGAAILAALALGIVNALIKPLMHLLALPITIITFGLFALVINGLMFGLAAGLVPGFTVLGFWPAFWGAIVYSVCSYLINGLLMTDHE